MNYPSSRYLILNHSTNASSWTAKSKVVIYSYLVFWHTSLDFTNQGDDLTSANLCCSSLSASILESCFSVATWFALCASRSCSCLSCDLANCESISNSILIIWMSYVEVCYLFTIKLTVICLALFMCRFVLDIPTADRAKTLETKFTKEPEFIKSTLYNNHLTFNQMLIYLPCITPAAHAWTSSISLKLVYHTHRKERQHETKKVF